MTKMVGKNIFTQNYGLKMSHAWRHHVGYVSWHDPRLGSKEPSWTVLEHFGMENPLSINDFPMKTSINLCVSIYIYIWLVVKGRYMVKDDGYYQWLMMINNNLAGGWAYPSEKWWSSSIGMMTFPTEWKVIKAMFQTTKQIYNVRRC